MTSNQDLLSVTAFFSAMFHAVVILGISFKLPDIAAVKNIDNTLDVVLINHANNEKPVTAETVSTSSNQGGGKDEKEASSPLPFRPVDASPVESIKLTAEQQPQTTLAPDQLITARRAEVQIERKQPIDSEVEARNKSVGEDKITTKSQRQLERMRLIAKLNKNWEDYQKRPIKKYLSPTTKEHEAARYLDDWRKKVEIVGNANYPAKAKANGLSGTLILTVEINRNGTIAAVLINNPSPHKILNDAAIRFVRDASPFASFPDQIDPKTDILVITRAFHFLNNNRLSSSDAAAQR
ncbi:MAG: TonB family protein [Gammaproteobacteria bacterium]|nr:TonB family protein [Gammaproteobacteria bacterium]